MFFLAVIELLLLVLLLLVVRGWIIVVWKLLHGQPILAWQPRRPVPWGLLDIVVSIMLLIMIVIALSAVARYGLQIPRAANQVAENTIDPVSVSVMSLAYFVWLPVVILVFVSVRGATVQDLGFDKSRIAEDVILGVKSFCMLAPIVFAIQAVLVMLGWESHHPLIEGMKANPQPIVLIAGAVTAVIMAPLLEEFIFRLLFQGWLENVVGLLSGILPRRSTTSLEAPTLGVRLETIWVWACLGPQPTYEPVLEPATDDLSPVIPNTNENIGDPYRSPNPLAPEAKARVPYSRDNFQLRAPWSYLPILVSTAIFALLHYDHGPDWVPLLFLAGGIGYIYQRTHRILPCITIHFLLNGFSYILFLVQIFMPIKPPE